MNISIEKIRQEATPWLLLLQKYYQGHLCNLDNETWDKVIQALKAEPTSSLPKIQEGMNLLLGTDSRTRQDMKYDFNRLFIGPDKLQAPPYESCYLNPERILMQAETLRVRSKYKEAGLEISHKNVEPDDFMGFELEFLLFLISSNQESHHSLIPQFLENHLFVWYKPHLEDIRSNSQHPVCLGIALIMEGIMEYFNTSINQV